MGILGSSHTVIVRVVSEISPITVELTVSPSQPWRINTTITLQAMVREDTRPISNAEVAFYYRVGEYVAIIGTARTDSYGVATYNYQIPASLGCHYVEFYAIYSNITSNMVGGSVNRATRIMLPASIDVLPGREFEVAGRVEVEGIGGWAPLSNVTVIIQFEGTEVSTITNTNGEFRVRLRAPQVHGDYTLRAFYRP